MSKIFPAITIYFSLFFSCYNGNAQPKYEFRAAWVATVDNIDWPSRGNFNTDSQKAEFISLLDMHKGHGMNAIIAQIRPATDALYPSQYEPWSEWLTGRQGRAPSPYYDPLEFMISETHKRGMEFHAWMNPYRAEFSVGKSSIAPAHITKLRPDWFLTYGDKRYFDPGNKEVQAFATNVVRDVVKRYDIDAIHFDDYFYPYRIANQEFPDNYSYSRYGNSLSKDDWRRSNVDSIIVSLAKVIKQENPRCKFGISPFGVWRNNDKDPEGSITKAGQTNYDDLYADILLWLKKGWIDYVAPQLYWEFGHKLVGYEVLIDWWAKHGYGKHIYIGHGIYRGLANKVPAWNNPNELPRQITSLRTYPEVQGSIYFSSKTFRKNPNGWNDSLQNNYYRYPALVPPMPWIDNIKPAKPGVEKLADGSLKISIASNSDARFVIVYCSKDGKIDTNDPSTIARMFIQPGLDTRFNLNSTRIPCGKAVGITVVDINNNESEVSLINF
ncbi:MAG: family 10 glycosylhydrolase [Chitinophagaceae bacterium]